MCVPPSEVRIAPSPAHTQSRATPTKKGLCGEKKGWISHLALAKVKIALFFSYFHSPPTRVSIQLYPDVHRSDGQ